MVLMSRFSVRRTLVFLVWGIGSVLFFFVLGDLQVSARNYRFAARVVALNEMANDCLLAVNDFAFERGRSLIILNGAAPISDEHRAFTDTRRQQSDQAVIRVLGALSVPGVASDGGREIRQAWSAVQRMRSELERDFALPRTGRDPALQIRWREAANHLIASLESALIGVSRLPDAEVSFDRMSSARILVLQFRDTVGQVAERIGSALANRTALSLTRQAEIHELRGRAKQQWVQLMRNAAAIGDARLDEALARVNSSYTFQLDPLNEQVLARVQARTLPAISAEHYSSVAVPALDTIINAIDGVTQLTRRYALQKQELARNQLLFDVLVLAITVLLMAGGLIIVRQRVSKPLGSVIERLHGLRGAGVRYQANERGDEFQAVERALDLLDEVLRMRERDAVLLAESNQKLVSLSVTDELTGLNNRRQFNQRLTDEWARARRGGRSLAVMMIDIDYFKRYNDRYGHQAGDECLIEVARVLAACVRRSVDSVSRYGGEEFVVVTPDTSVEQAAFLAQEILAAVVALGLPHADSEHAVVTLSIGVAAVIPSGTWRAEDLLRQADQALYEAKNGGRNRVQCASS